MNTHIKNWFGMGQSIGWVATVLVGGGIAWGVLRADVSSVRDQTRFEISRIDARALLIENQMRQTRENQATMKSDVQNIKAEIGYIRKGVDDLKQMMIDQNRRSVFEDKTR
jgi:hypothetical protein